MTHQAPVRRISRLLAACTLERGLIVGGILASVGAAGLIAAFNQWHAAHFGHLNYEVALRIVLPAVTALMLSFQLVLGTFFLSILGIRRTHQLVVLDVGGPSEPATAPKAPAV